jgi:hypothetical protein
LSLCAMRTYGGVEASGQLHALAALPPVKDRPVPTGQEAGWAPNPVWSLWRREQTLAPTVNRTPVYRLSSP